MWETVWLPVLGWSFCAWGLWRTARKSARVVVVDRVVQPEVKVSTVVNMVHHETGLVTSRLTGRVEWDQVIPESYVRTIAAEAYANATQDLMNAASKEL